MRAFTYTVLNIKLKLFQQFRFESKNPTHFSGGSMSIEKGLADLKARPEHFKTFNSPNGWGMYEHFVPFVEKYLEACKEYPDAIVGVSR